MEITISELVATCLQRMISDEIENQKKWAKEDEKNGFKHDFAREQIIEEMQKLENDIEAQGIRKYWRFN